MDKYCSNDKKPFTQRYVLSQTYLSVLTKNLIAIFILIIAIILKSGHSYCWDGVVIKAVSVDAGDIWTAAFSVYVTGLGTVALYSQHDMQY